MLQHGQMLEFSHVLDIWPLSTAIAEVLRNSTPNFQLDS